MEGYCITYNYKEVIYLHISSFYGSRGSFPHIVTYLKLPLQPFHLISLTYSFILEHSHSAIQDSIGGQMKTNLYYRSGRNIGRLLKKRTPVMFMMMFRLIRPLLTNAPSKFRQCWYYHYSKER